MNALRLLALGTVLATLGSAGQGASAQERRPTPQQAAPAAPASPAPAPASAQASSTFPSQTAATYGDWVHRCVRVGADAAQQSCEIVQQVQANQGGQVVPVLTLAVGRPGPQAPLQISALLPVNISFSAPPALAVEGAAASELRFVRCVGSSCFASVVVSDALLAKLRDVATKGPRIEFRNAAEAPVAVPFSLNGFGQALDALQARR